MAPSTMVSVTALGTLPYRCQAWRITGLEYRCLSLFTHTKARLQECVTSAQSATDTHSLHFETLYVPVQQQRATLTIHYVLRLVLRRTS